jgi:hypothetical protein
MPQKIHPQIPLKSPFDERLNDFDALGGPPPQGDP